MKERPILFSAPMVRAILAGTKTQTRRVVKIQPIWSDAHRCPYGQPVDRLWVRETHAPQADCWGAWHNWSTGAKNGPKPIIHYAADGGDPFIEKWRPSIHMPRWASRINLEITGVRVERLQDISENDAVAEGIELIGGNASCSPWKDYSKEQVYKFFSAPSNSYRSLWESINGPGSWDANPWVWCISFRRID